MCLFWAALGLRCCVQAFSSCGERGLLLVAVRGAPHCGGFSCCGARALGARASVVEARGLSRCGSQAVECRLSSCGARASLLCGMWDLPGPGLEPVSPALAGGFLTTVPQGKPRIFLYISFRGHIQSSLPNSEISGSTADGYLSLVSIAKEFSKVSVPFVVFHILVDPCYFQYF